MKRSMTVLAHGIIEYGHGRIGDGLKRPELRGPLGRILKLTALNDGTHHLRLLSGQGAPCLIQTGQGGDCSSRSCPLGGIFSSS